MVKRGLSDIVTNVLIILIVLVAIGILWTFVSPFLRQTAGSIGTEQFGKSLEVVSSTVVINLTNRSVQLSLLRAADSSLPTSVNFVIEDSAGHKETVNRPVPQGFNELETRSFFVNYSTNIGTVVKISIAPVFTVNGREQSGGIVSSYDVGSGAAGTPPQGGGSGPVCGDAVCNGGETQASCPVDCDVAAVCGNGAVESGEACDDGNVANGDGCSSVCGLESGWQCSGAPSACLQFTVLSPTTGLYDRIPANAWVDINFSVSGGVQTCWYTNATGGSSVTFSGVQCQNNNHLFFLSQNTSGCTYAQNLDSYSNATSNNIWKFITCPTFTYNVSVFGTKNSQTLNKPVTFASRSCPGDVNRDGFVNGNDQFLIISASASAPCPAGTPTYCPLDTNGNGIVQGGGSGVDTNFWIANYADSGRLGACRSTTSCGNGVIDTGEQCDGAAGAPTGTCNRLNGELFYRGTKACLQCLSSCDIGTQRCGDGIVNPNSDEECDGGPGCTNCLLS